MLRDKSRLGFLEWNSISIRAENFVCNALHSITHNSFASKPCTLTLCGVTSHLVQRRKLEVREGGGDRLSQSLAVSTTALGEGPTLTPDSHLPPLPFLPHARSRSVIIRHEPLSFPSDLVPRPDRAVFFPCGTSSLAWVPLPHLPKCLLKAECKIDKGDL